MLNTLTIWKNIWAHTFVIIRARACQQDNHNPHIESKWERYTAYAKGNQTYTLMHY